MAIDPEAMYASAQQIARCAEDFDTGLSELEATVTTKNPWGGDEPGTVFGMAYTQVLGYALEVYGSHIGQLVTAAEGLASMVASVIDSDSQSAVLMGDIESKLGG